MKKILVVLAAGIGSRFGGVKQVAKVGPNGEALLNLTLEDAIQAGFTDVIYVIRKDIEEDFREVIGNIYHKQISTHYVYQEIEEGRLKPWGTAHALLCALPSIDAPCLVLNADDYYGTNTMLQAAQWLDNCKANHYGMIGYKLSNTLSENGGVNRGVCVVENGVLVSIHETLGIKPEGNLLIAADGTQVDPESVVSMNFWMFHPSVLVDLKDEFETRKTTAGEKNEYYIPVYCSYLMDNDKAKCEVLVAQDNWYGITYKEDIAAVSEALARK